MSDGDFDSAFGICIGMDSTGAGNPVLPINSARLDGRSVDHVSKSLAECFNSLPSDLQQRHRQGVVHSMGYLSELADTLRGNTAVSTMRPRAMMSAVQVVQTIMLTSSLHGAKHGMEFRD